MEGYRGTDRRESERTKASFIVRMRFPRLEDFRYRYTRDISRGGVFIQTPRPKPVGASVQLILEPGGGAGEIALHGEVVTAVEPEEAARRGLQAGMGIRFVDLDEDKRSRIERLLLGEPPAAVAAAPPTAASSLQPPAPPIPRPAARDHAAEITRTIAEAREFLAAAETRDLYEILGVERSANAGEIRRAFLKLTRRFHPDNVFRRADAEATQLLEDVYDHLTRAYETLTNRDLRIAYDLSIGYLGGNRDGVTAAEMERAAAEARRRKIAPSQVKRAEQLYAQAMQDLAAGQTAKALANLKLALAFDPDNAQIREKIQEHAKKP